MLVLPMPTGIIQRESPREAPDPSSVSAAYLSWERKADIIYATAFFGGSGLLVPLAAVATPPLAIVFGIGAGLGLAGSFALGFAALMPTVSDEELHKLFGMSGLFTPPGLFFAPAGGAIAGKEGVQIALDFGGLAWDLFTIGITPGEPKPLSELFKNAREIGEMLANGFLLYRDSSFTLEDLDDDAGSSKPNSVLLESTESTLRPDDFEPPNMPSMEDAPGMPDQGFTPGFPSTSDDSDLMLESIL
jgi:MFS family permease